MAERVSEQGQEGYVVTRSTIQIYALKKAKEAGIGDTIASPRWCNLFMN